MTLSKRDLELCKIKDDLDKATNTLEQFNSNSTKIDSILMMGKDSKAGLASTTVCYLCEEPSNSRPNRPFL